MSQTITKKTTKARRETKFDDYIGLPVESSMKKQIAEIARGDERNATDMTRVLLKEAIAARNAPK